MNKRQLGNTDLHVSEIGLGCWQLGGDFGPISEGTAKSILERGVEKKINFYDTADVYGGGQSEKYVGEALDPKKDNLIIATKYGRGPETYPDKYSLTNMRDAIKRSQDRLQTDCIDLIQLHCIPTEVMAHGEVFDWLRTIQQEGLVRYWGASVETIEEALICTRQDGLASLQIIFNLFRQRPITELFDEAKEKGVGIIVRLPLASGMLSGKYTKDTTFDESDHRNFNKDGAAFSVGETFSGIEFNKGLELVEKLREFKPEGMDMAQFAMRWILDQDAVSTVIAGASKPEHVDRNVAASDFSALPADLHKSLFEFYQKEVDAHIRGVK